ncbi:hypothetical protein BKA66DRAFT_450771 [Pyrenochaeta sp. MPI-SDFR-AT-0127]|nr:hypothetical protein BKA66DRAFT_450771 [Pyrenochaeta sp. MPI-SDFR-AT-0127]
MAANGQIPKNILVFGATGVIGKYIVQELYEAKSSFEKVGIFTSPSTAETKKTEVNSLKEKGIDVIVGDVQSKVDVAKAYKGYDTVISALGRNAILSQIPLLELAEESSSIRYFYPSEYGTDIEFGPSSAFEKPHQLKLQIRKYIRENIRKLNVTYLVTGPYSDLYFAPASTDNRVGSFNVREQKATLLGTGNEKVSFTTMKDVGRLLVAALTTPTSIPERILKVNSFTTTGNEVLAEFERQTSATWGVSYTPLDELKRLEKEAWERGDGTVFTLRRIWTEGGTLYKERSNGDIGFEGEESLEEQIGKMIANYG